MVIERAQVKRVARILLTLLGAWIIASLGVRFAATLLLGMNNSEISFWIASALAVAAVIACLRYEHARGNAPSDGD